MRTDLVAAAVVGIIAGTVGTHLWAAQERSRAEQELLNAQATVAKASSAADLATIDRMTADEWVQIGANGPLRTKQQRLEEIKKRGPRPLASDDELLKRQTDWRVHVYNDVGLVNRLTAGDNGPRLWITAVWVKRNGRWQRVLNHESTAAATATSR